MSAPSSPSPRTAELIRTACGLLLEQPDAVFDEVDDVVLADANEAIRADPGLVEAIRRANRANLMAWASANVRDPGAPVRPNLGPETVDIARDLVRRGLDARAVDAYRTGQNVAWRMWMALVFTLTSDPAELAELLDVTARSIFAFVDETIAGTTAQVERELEELRADSHAARLDVVTLVLEGAPIGEGRASARLRYALDRPHTGAVVFHTGAEPDHGVLARAVEALAGREGTPLVVTASASALWAWVPGAGGPDLDAVRAAIDGLPDVRVAVGGTAGGMAGFRRTHLDALATQRLLYRGPERVRVASYDEVQVVALATHDEERAHEFVERALGGLAGAPEELRETVRTYVREGCSASAAGRVLFAHRNTVLSRIARADELLPVPLKRRTVQVAVALDVLRWLGPR